MSKFVQRLLYQTRSRHVLQLSVQRMVLGSKRRKTPPLYVRTTELRETSGERLSFHRENDLSGFESFVFTDSGGAFFGRIPVTDIGVEWRPKRDGVVGPNVALSFRLVGGRTEEPCLTVRQVASEEDGKKEKGFSQSRRVIKV
ncbi:hypothetical protein RUM43_010438 [Polyplax serrata]|uniref:Uncharacterized protein n=1 Tax=Polyplax serrata TaxID=468196 RepID=A0AAN8S9Z6_POLSC